MPQKLTLEDFQEAARARGGLCLSTEYINARSQLSFECSKGHRWDTAGLHIRSGHWCPTCARAGLVLGLAPHQALARSKGGICLSASYVDANQRLRWQCAHGHRWLATGSNVRNNDSWCPMCAHESRKRPPDAPRSGGARASA